MSKIPLYYTDTEFFSEFNTTCYINKEKMTGEFPLYRHDFIEVSLILEGEGKEIINGSTFDVKPGSLSVCMPWHFHTLETKNQPIVRFICEFSMEDYLHYASVWEDAQSMLYQKNLSPSINLKSNQLDKVKRIFNDMYDVFTMNGIHKQTLLYLKLVEFMAQFHEYQLQTQYHEENKDLLIPQALKLIHGNFSTDLTLAQLSHSLGCSQRHLSEQIQAYTGQDFQQLLNDIRVRNACVLLGLKTPTIQYISENTGFNSIQSFYRSFKRAKGVTPDEFRKAHREVSEGKAGYLMVNNDAWEISYYMHKNYKNDIRPEDVADHLGISLSYLHKIVKYNFMQTFNEMLREIRIDYSCGLLRGTELSITQIAIEVGYNSYRTYNRAFQSFKGISASEYRNMYSINH